MAHLFFYDNRFFYDNLDNKGQHFIAYDGQLPSAESQNAKLKSCPLLSKLSFMNNNTRCRQYIHHCLLFRFLYCHSSSVLMMFCQST